MQRVATGRQALESERTPNTDRTRSHPAGSRGSTDPRNKWIATSSPKTGFLTAGRNASVTLVTPPGIVPGIKTNPLLASNAPVFVRLPMGYLLATGDPGRELPMPVGQVWPGEVVESRLRDLRRLLHPARGDVNDRG